MSNSCFYLRPEKDDNKVILEDKDLEVIGSSGVIQYDDTNVILQHIESGLWFSYKVCILDKRTRMSNMINLKQLHIVPIIRCYLFEKDLSSQEKRSRFGRRKTIDSSRRGKNGRRRHICSKSRRGS